MYQRVGCSAGRSGILAADSSFEASQLVLCACCSLLKNVHLTRRQRTCVFLFSTSDWHRKALFWCLDLHMDINRCIKKIEKIIYYQNVQSIKSAPYYSWVWNSVTDVQPEIYNKTLDRKLPYKAVGSIGKLWRPCCDCHFLTKGSVNKLKTLLIFLFLR